MPPRRQGRRSLASEVITADVPHDKPIPSFFLEALQVQYSQDIDEPDRPAKRRRTEPEVESIPIIREHVSISRPSDEVSLGISYLKLHRLQSSLRFSFDDHEPDGSGPAGAPALVISTPPSTKTEPFAVTFPLESGAISDRLATILEARNAFWSNPNVEDATWISATAELDANDDVTTLTLFFQVNWNISTTTYPSPASAQHRRFRQEMLALAYPAIFERTHLKKKNSCSPQIFYEAAHVPPTDDTPPEHVSIPYMTTKLYPFQRRAVKWMLGREGVQWNHDEEGDSVINDVGFGQFDAPSAFVDVKDVDGHTFHLSPLLGKATKDVGLFENLEQGFRGGILSEEMGLGKTVELLALFSLHRQTSDPTYVFDNYLGEQVKTAPATLIVAPSSLKKQWLSELGKHAPGLRIMLYEGLSQSAREEESKAKALIAKLASQDVVVTTYNVLTYELDYALGEPDRARRAPRKYHRPRSPLTQLRWWRVCLDEAQMIESGVSKAATLAKLIPRVNAWGVTGTPVKDSVEDLRGLLLFLRYEPFASNINAWDALVQSHEDGFRRLFNQLSLRHSKRLVRHEISIPPQKRYVITMPFTAVEEQHYRNLFLEVVEACGLGSNGEPLRDDWDPDDPGVLEAMRTALDRLRQTALHPEVGTRNRKALGHRNGPMRTVAEVLDVMIEQSEFAIRTAQRALLMSRLTRGQLMENSPRVKSALEIWKGVLDASNEIVAECREKLKQEIEQVKAARPNTIPSADGDESEDEIDATNTGKVGDARRRLRYALEIQHKSMFFVANAHYQIKTNPDFTQPESEDFQRLEKLEIEGYEQAKVVRREILEESRSKVLKLMKKIAASASEQSFAVIPEYELVEKRGLESRAIFESLEILAGELNIQADRLDDWREYVIQLLLKPLVDEEDEVEITGEEYEDSTKLMEEIVVYIQILRTLIADREDVMSGQINDLVRHEAKTSLRQAKEGEGPYPEKVVELFRLREEIKPRSERSLRAVVSELRALSVKLRHDVASGSSRAKLELEIVMEQLKATQKQLSEQQKIATAMNQEIDVFMSTMNARVEFYRQLQDVSDMVAPYEGPTTAAEENRLLAEEEATSKKLETAQSKHRYLLHLKDMDAVDGDQRQCVICRENFVVGVLTVCGHQFCKECITLWLRANRNCPVCKKHLNSSNLHDIVFKPQELKVYTEANGGPSPSKKQAATNGVSSHHAHNTAPVPKQSAIYTEFSANKLAEIKNIDLDGPAFTTKVDNLVRHLLWLRENDPGAKSIIFSQYADFLSVIGLALKRYRVGFTSFERPNGISDFKEDPSVECFLLHARAHASGLNLVNASHVFLMEPLVNTALELQAIARVHRIGQEHETTVWLYIVDGTVEESIYNLSVRRRMEHMQQGAKKHASLRLQQRQRQQQTRSDRNGKSKEAPTEGDRDKDKEEEAGHTLADEMIEAANSMELEHASLSKLMARGKRQGEAVDKADLWECLFGGNSSSSTASNQGQNKTSNSSSHNNNNNNNDSHNPGPAIRGFLAAEAAEERMRQQ